MARALAALFSARQLTARGDHIIMISYLREAEVANKKVIALTATSERRASTMSGYVMLIVLLLSILAVIYGVRGMAAGGGDAVDFLIVIAATLVFILVMPGFYMLQPNQAAAITMYCSYMGSDRTTGLRWTWPWLTKKKLSVRANNFISDKIKVNDLRGNPIEMAAQIVWRVVDTAQALFDVDDYRSFVSVQVEAAIRTIGSRYPYDDFEHQEVTLRGNHDQVGAELRTELQARLAVAGITVDECGFTHLAYAQEIAGAMLRRQQAQAVVAARKTLVEGAVGMVEMALASLSEKKVVELDDERRAAMVSNLMVVLCGERDTQPVVNTGTLYQ
jgi:regulator of protease activity HflC (stomatin/prohibitin superfamily)